MVGAGDDRFAGFQRLAQSVEHVRLEFRQLVEKQHAVMGERNFTGRGREPPPTRDAMLAE